MTKEELKEQSPQTFAFTESLGETETFLTWEKYHQDVFVLMCETAETMASRTEISMEKYRQIQEKFLAEHENEEGITEIRDYSDAFLRYVESLRKNS